MFGAPSILRRRWAKSYAYPGFHPWTSLGGPKYPRRGQGCQVRDGKIRCFSQDPCPPAVWNIGESGCPGDRITGGGPK